jgi:Flp pilus assembly protein TadG
MVTTCRRFWTRGGPNGLLDALLRGWISQAGSTAVEFAIGLPVFLALLFGVMEGGRAIFTQAVLFYAAEEATRWAIVNGQDTGAGETLVQYEQRIETYARNQLILISPDQTSTAAATAPTNPVDNTRTLSVTLTYNYRFLLPYVGSATGPIQMSATSSGFLAEN